MAGRIIAISDFCTTVPPEPVRAYPACSGASLSLPSPVPVTQVGGGYLERLPLAAVAAGLAQSAEIWSFAGRDGEADTDTGRLAGTPDPRYPGLTRRVFRADDHPAPYGSAEAVAHLRETGPPEILCVWGLGVTSALLQAAGPAIKIYNSIDAPALRIPDDLAAHFDLFLTGADWQSREIRARVPGARCLVLPIGPEFASGETFHPTGATKDRDVVYVACAQNYKRHDILFEALTRRPGTTALLVIGYGDLRDHLEREAARLGLDVEFIGPPGVSHEEVNRQINRARVGVVCGRDDGAPAILTEYQLADLPVLANSELCCGLQYITPQSGLAAAPDAEFARALDHLITHHASYHPRAQAIAQWGWQASIKRLKAETDAIRS